MIKRVSKFIISLATFVFLGVGFSVSAFADVVGGAALLGGASSSLGVDLLAGGSATVAALAPWINGDFSIIGALTGVADGYIKVGEESVTIDGVEYESIFLDPSMAAELHTQAFDFFTQHAITSNSSGILASGYGTLYDVPMFTRTEGQNTYYESQIYNCPIGTSSYMGSVIITPEFRPYQRSVYTTINPPGTAASISAGPAGGGDPTSVELYFTTSSTWSPSGYAHLIGKADNRPVAAFTLVANYDLSLLVNDPFDYSYVAGTIDATPLPQDYGFQLFVPTQTLSQAGYLPGTYVIDGGAGTDQITEIIELLDGIYDSVVNPEFTDSIDPPPVPPQPIDTPLGEVPYQDFLDTFGQSVYGKLDSISDGIDTVGQVIAGQGTDVIEAVDTAGQSVVDELEVIGGAIDTAGQSVVDSVEESTGILEEAIEAVEAKVDELVDSIAEVVEEIMTHPLDLFSAWLDRLPEIPAIKDIFDGIKRHVGIWHYVVEWLGCIGSFLAFFIGLFGDVAYCMVVPIYACVAGAICLAFYKRFAR